MNSPTEHRAHAICSASGSGKWLVCTPSARLEEGFPDEGSAFASEGTLAHEAFDAMLRCYLNGNDDAAVAHAMAIIATLPEGMLDHVQEAFDRGVKLIIDAYARCPDPVILAEKRLDYSRWVPEGFGKGDLVIITDDLVDVADLKYGKGVLVPAQGNSQMRLYGLGAYNELSHLYPIKRVRMHVFQPRLDNWGSEELSVEELLTWAEDVVVPKAKLAFAGEGEMVAGDHCHSSFCRARFTCPERDKARRELAETSFSLQPPAALTVQQMAQVLSRADQVIRWLSDVKEWAFQQAEKGNPVPGFKLVEGRSNRKYRSEEEIINLLNVEGIPEALVYKRNLIGITEMEKLLGKKKFAEVLGNAIEKPQGKPTLVPESDKRPALDMLSYFETEESQEDPQ